MTMVQIAIRLPEDLIEEVDQIVQEHKDDPMARAERSAVIRTLLLEALEQRKRKAARK